MAISDIFSDLYLFFGMLILFFGWATFWYLWITGRPYRHFPSFRLDAYWLLNKLTGKHPKNLSTRSIIFQELVKKSEKFYGDGLCVMWLLRPYLLVFGENVVKILANEPDVANKSSEYEEVLKEVFGNGLLGSSGKLWKDHRKLLNPVFSLGILKGNMDIFNENAKILVNKFQSTMGKPTEDMLTILKRCTFRVLEASIFDLHTNKVKLEPRAEVLINLIEEITDLLMYKIQRPWLRWRFVSAFYSVEKKFKESIKKSRIYVDEIVDDLINTYTASEIKEEYLDNEMDVKRTLCQVLIKQHLEDPTFTKDDLSDHLKNFAVAGYETISYSLMWCLYVLGQHPEVQKEACNEIESAVRAEDVKYDDLGKLKYLDCIIKESLRLYTTIPIYGRKLSKDICYDKYTIPKDTEVIFCPFLLHRNPDIFPEPMKYKPERFADSSTVRPGMYMPFGEGYRNCIGKKFALMEMKVLLVHILREFQIKSLNTVTDKDLDWAVMLKPTKPLRMLFETRAELDR